MVDSDEERHPSQPLASAGTHPYLHMGMCAHTCEHNMNIHEACTHTHTWECAHTHMSTTRMHMRGVCTHTHTWECAHTYVNTTGMHMREIEAQREITSPGKQRDVQHLKETGIKIKSGSDIDQSASTQCYGQDKGHEPPSYPRIIHKVVSPGQ